MAAVPSESADPINGRPRSEKWGHPLQTKTFETRAAAKAWARAIEVEMDKGVFVSRAEAESTTLKELLERYLAEITPLKKGAAPEAARLRAFMKHPLARRFVAGIHGLDIARFRDERLGKVSTGTVKRDLVILGHVFEVARKEWGIQVPNPVRDINLPANGKARDRRLRPGGCGEASEEDRLLEACRKARNPSLLPIVRLALETAMRQSELVGLRWEHLDLTHRIAHIPDTKNGEARTVPLSSTAVHVLRALPRNIHGQVSPGLTAEAVKRAFARATRRAGIEDLHFHDLRHEATTRLFELGLNIREVATVTGHKDLRMLRRYTHLKAEDLEKSWVSTIRGRACRPICPFKRASAQRSPGRSREGTFCPASLEASLSVTMHQQTIQIALESAPPQPAIGHIYPAT